MDVSPRTCERAAELVSLDLDGELSRFERALLARHLRRCGACADSAARVTAATELLRRAPLEALRVPIALPSSRRRLGLPRVVQGVAATAAVATLGIWFAVSSTETVRESAQFGGFDVRATLVSDPSDWPGGVVPKRPPVTPFLPGGQRGLQPRVRL
jgi:anti-sigma factor RsiW